MVLGIFLGLQVSQWYEGRQELALKASILERLHSEFEAIAGEVDGAIRFHQDEVLALELVHQSIKKGNVSAADESSFRMGLRNATSYDLGSGRSGTYVEILSSGQFRLIQDQELRSALSRYDQLVSQADSLFSIFQENQRKYEPILDRYVTYGPVQRRESDKIMTGEFFVAGDVVEYDIDAMLLDEQFLNAMRRLMEYHVYFQVWHSRVSLSAQRVLGLIDSDQRSLSPKQTDE